LETLFPFLILGSAAVSSETSGNSTGFLDNPFLFYVLSNSNRSENLDNLILMSILSSTSQLTNSSKDHLLTLPLNLKSFPDIERVKRNDLIPFFFSPDLHHHFNMTSSASAVSLMLDDEDEDVEIKDLLPILLTSSLGGAGINIQESLPLLLMSDRILNKSISNNFLLSLLGGRSSKMINLLNQSDLNSLKNDPNILSLLNISQNEDEISNFLKISDEKNFRKILIFIFISDLFQQDPTSLFPLLLSEDASLVEIEDLLMLMIIGGNQIKSLNVFLPLLLRDSHQVDHNMLMMIGILSRFEDFHIDQDGLKIPIKSPLNLLLPLMMLHKSGESDLSDLLLLIYVTTPQEARFNF